jgi:hypothetical protein
MSTGKLLAIGTVAATFCTLFFFRGDIQRYMKMKMM